MIEVYDISNLPYKVGGLLESFKSLVDGHHRLAEDGNGAFLCLLKRHHPFIPNHSQLQNIFNYRYYVYKY